MAAIRPELTHEWIWQAVDGLARRNGMTPSALARMAGLDPTAFNPSKRFTPEGRPRWPSTESISKILEATGTSLSEFADAKTCEPAVEEGDSPELDRVPLVGQIREATVTALGKPGRARQRSAIVCPLQPRFALAVTDGSLEPVYSSGNTLILSAQERVREGDKVVVKLFGEEAVPRILYRQTKARVELAPIAASDAHRRLGRNRIDWMARIIWVRQ